MKIFGNFGNFAKINRKIQINILSVRHFCEQSKADSTSLEKDFLKLDYYSILGVNRNATDLDIKKSYFHLAKKFHPDKYKGHSEIFKKISDAYNTLKDEHKREEYNKRMRFKIRKKYKQSNDSAAETPNKPQQDYSKYEGDFKKLNIDKLFIEFTHRKIKTAPSAMKIFKSALERKMTKREYNIQQFLRALDEERVKNKSLSYKFYKSMGMVKEKNPDEKQKSYEEMVEEEIKKIKLKITPKEEVKMEEKKEKEEEGRQTDSMMRLIKYVGMIYAASVVVIFYVKFRNKRKEKEDKEEIRKRLADSRMNSYVYLSSRQEGEEAGKAG